MYKEYLKRAVFDEIEKAKMSKKDLAAKLNITLPTYYKYEKDMDMPVSKLVILIQEINKTILIVDKYDLP